MKLSLLQWMEKGLYLPSILRDFHDQKDIFKTIHSRIDVKSNPLCGEVNWVAAHVYVIDIFLWFMALRGYTLQRSRMPFDFQDIQENVSEYREMISREFAEELRRKR